MNNLLSLARTPPWQPGGRLDGPGQHPDPLTRGEYLVHAEMCGLCHTHINPTGIYRADDFYLSGGMRVVAYPQGVFVSRNLTSDLETDLGRWSEAQIATAIREGRARRRLLNIWGMPWMFLHRLTDADARAIATYLKALPPVRNAVPDPLHYGTLETLAVKLTRTLPAVPPKVLTYTEGNFGARGAGMARDVPQRVLVAAQWVVLVAGVVGFMVAGPPHTVRAWVLTVVVVVGVFVLALLAAVIVCLPALAVIPPEQIGAGRRKPSCSSAAAICLRLPRVRSATARTVRAAPSSAGVPWARCGRAISRPIAGPGSAPGPTARSRAPSVAASRGAGGCSTGRR